MCSVPQPRMRSTRPGSYETSLIRISGMSRPVRVRKPSRVISRRLVTVYVEKYQFRNGFSANVARITTPTARIAIRAGVCSDPVGTIAARNPPSATTTSSRSTGPISAFQCVRVLTTTYSSSPNNFAEIAMSPVSQFPGPLVPSRHDASRQARSHSRGLLTRRETAVQRSAGSRSFNALQSAYSQRGCAKGNHLGAGEGAGMAILSVLDREHTVAPPGYSRWLIPPAALAVHLCIGQAYATSVYKTSMVKHFDTSQTAVGVVFSIAIVMLGLSAAVGGTWVEANGPRKAMFVSACFWGAGFLVGALGIGLTQLWLVYLGYGVLGGIGLGIGYISPVSTLIRWFPDRPGLATGLAIMGFGGGALIAAPLSNKLLETFADQPADAIAPAFVTLGCIYFVAMTLGAFTVQLPEEGWKPAGWEPDRQAKRRMITSANVTAANAIRTPQFWLLWVVLCCNVTAGIGILEQASPMIQDHFDTVSAAAAAGFVGLLSLCNMSGRFVWSSTSDVIGRKRMYMIYLGVGAVLYLLLASTGTASIAWFVLLTGIILSFYGGGFSTVPAYLKDLFGTIQVGAIHGRLLTAWSAAGVAGPLIVNAIADHQAAGGKSGADLYTLSLFIMVGVLVVGFIANLLIRPVNERFHEPADRHTRFERTEPATTATRS